MVQLSLFFLSFFLFLLLYFLPADSLPSHHLEQQRLVQQSKKGPASSSALQILVPALGPCHHGANWKRTDSEPVYKQLAEISTKRLVPTRRLLFTKYFCQQRIRNEGYLEPRNVTEILRSHSK